MSKLISYLLTDHFLCLEISQHQVLEKHFWICICLHLFVLTIVLDLSIWLWDLFLFLRPAWRWAVCFNELWMSPDFAKEEWVLLSRCCLVMMNISLTPAGPLGWLDWTDKFQQNQWLKDRFRSGCDQPEGGRTGEGKLCTTGLNLNVMRRCTDVCTHTYSIHTHTHSLTRVSLSAACDLPPISLAHVSAPPWIIYSINKRASEALQCHKTWIKELICNYKLQLRHFLKTSEALCFWIGESVWPVCALSVECPILKCIFRINCARLLRKFNVILSASLFLDKFMSTIISCRHIASYDFILQYFLQLKDKTKYNIIKRSMHHSCLFHFIKLVFHIKHGCCNWAFVM